MAAAIPGMLGPRTSAQGAGSAMDAALVDHGRSAGAAHALPASRRPDRLIVLVRTAGDRGATPGGIAIAIAASWRTGPASAGDGPTLDVRVRRVVCTYPTRRGGAVDGVAGAAKPSAESARPPLAQSTRSRRFIAPAARRRLLPRRCGRAGVTAFAGRKAYRRADGRGTRRSAAQTAYRPRSPR